MAETIKSEIKNPLSDNTEKHKISINHPIEELIAAGVMFTKCPTRYAKGIWPQKNLRQVN